MRKLAHIEKIDWIKPHPNADRLDLVGILGWQCVVGKGEFHQGDTCVYIEIDSILDSSNEYFASNPMIVSKHFKIKTQKIRGILSQGLVVPMSILPESGTYNIGDDVTTLLKVTETEDDVLPSRQKDPIASFRQTHKKLYNNKLFKWFMRFKWFRSAVLVATKPKRKAPQFPSYVVKTDETRIQNMPFVIEQYKNVPMIVTEKLDGTSTTFALSKVSKHKRDFAVCSRNVRQLTPKQKCFYDENVYIEMAEKYKAEQVLNALMNEYQARTVVLQGETIGDGIQENKYSLTGHDFYAFNLIIDGQKIDSQKACDIVHKYGIKWVPILDVNFKLLSSVEEMVAYADAKSTIADTLREGVVIRDHDNTTSFKCISNEFLLEHKI